MIRGIGLEHLAGIRPKVFACSVRAKSAIVGAGAFVLMLFSASAAQAQCTPVGLNPAPSFPTQAAVAAIAGVSAYVGSLVSSIHTANTAFLAQSTAFIGAPANPQPDQQGGGAWARGVGGHLSFGTTAKAGNINFGGPVAGSVVCDTRTLGDFAGVQIGADVARLNVNGWNLHAGSTIGYLGSKTRDATPSGLNPPASFQRQPPDPIRRRLCRCKQRRFSRRRASSLEFFPERGL